MLKIVQNQEIEQEGRSVLDELARQGAQKMLQMALEAEVEEYLQARHHERDERGHALVVRHGKGRPRKVMCGAGSLQVQQPRVRERQSAQQPEGRRFRSTILPPYMRRSPKLSEVLPILYLRGLSTSDFRPALAELLGPEAGGLSPSNITRLTSVWEQEYREFEQRSFKDSDYVYVWVDGIHFNVRLEQQRLCTLVMIGARSDGQKELLAVSDGFRESKESWAEVLRSLKERGLNAPRIAVGDGALGFWAALRDVFAETKEQRCFCHKMSNVLDKFPKSLQPKVKAKLRDIMYGETKEQALKLIKRFEQDYQSKYPKAVACLLKDQEPLLTFFDFPAEHWKHLRTTNVIESPFATVRLRQRVTKGAGSRNKALCMAFKLLDMAQSRWRKLSAPHLLQLVAQGQTFVDGIQVKPNPTSRKNAA